MDEQRQATFTRKKYSPHTNNRKFSISIETILNVLITIIFLNKLSNKMCRFIIHCFLCLSIEYFAYTVKNIRRIINGKNVFDRVFNKKRVYESATYHKPFFSVYDEDNKRFLGL
jgi:hypothetical protein